MNNECDRDPLGFQPHLPGTHVATWRSLLQKDAVSNSMEYIYSLYRSRFGRLKKSLSHGDLYRSSE